MNILNDVTPSLTIAPISSSVAGVHVGHDHVEAVVDRRLALGLARATCRAPARSEPPFDWIAKSTIVVVPPCAAASVPVSKSSDEVVPPNGMSMCVCASMPPGMTYLPRRVDRRRRRLPSSACPARRAPAILPFSIQTSADERVARRDDGAALDQRARASAVLRQRSRTSPDGGRGRTARCGGPPRSCRGRASATTSSSLSSLRARDDLAARIARSTSCRRTCRCSTAPRCRRG